MGVRAGLWLPVRSVHTWGMRYPLDLVWLVADGQVLRIDEAVWGNSIRTCRRATGGVVETAVGAGRALAAELELRAEGARTG